MSETLYFQRKRAGLCGTCGNAPPVEGKAQCAQCRERQKPGVRAARRCGCGGSLAYHCSLCATCKKERQRARGRRKSRETRAKRRAGGLCIKCGKVPLSGRLCQACRAKATALGQRRERRLVGELRCKKCGQASPYFTLCGGCCRRHPLLAKGWDVEQSTRQGGKCHWCNASLARGRVHRDHVIPVSRGGTNDPSNMVLACAGCNQRRGADSRGVDGQGLLL